MARTREYNPNPSINLAFIDEAKEKASVKRDRRNKRRLFLLGRGGFYIHKVRA